MLFSVHIDGFSQLCVSGCLPHPHPAGKTNPVVCGAPLLKRAPAIHAHVRRGEKKNTASTTGTPTTRLASQPLDGTRRQTGSRTVASDVVRGVGGGGWLYRGML